MLDSVLAKCSPICWMSGFIFGERYLFADGGFLFRYFAPKFMCAYLDKVQLVCFLRFLCSSHNGSYSMTLASAFIS